jgi:TonB family protein
VPTFRAPEGLKTGFHQPQPDRIRAMSIQPHRLAIVLLIPLCCPLPAHAGESNTVRGTALLQQTRTIAETAFNQSLRQSGKLTVLAASKKLEGTYTYMSDGAVWRDEVVLPGYTEVRIRTGNQEKVRRPEGYDPLAIYAVFHAVRPINWLELRPDEHIRKEEKEKVEKLPASCVEIESKNERRTVCVYDDGTLAAVRSGTGWNYEYSEYSIFGKAQLPGTIRASENDNPIFELRMDTAQALTPGTNVADDLTHPTLTLGWCKGITGAVLEKQIPPHYPEKARERQTQGTVDLYGIIAADGHVTNLAPVRSAGVDLDQSSLDAVSNWLYHPAMCGTHPIPSETVITIHYSISPRTSMF